jgi:osmoprotectant transport system ATP-binding protein
MAHMTTPNASGSSGGAALEAIGVTKLFGRARALDHVTLRVAQGECVALVGESGSGKTTLLRCFNRMVRPDAGEIRVGGTVTTDADAVSLRRSLGYVPQDGGLLPHWTILRNVALVPWLDGLADATARATDALDLVGMPAATFGARWPAELSGGQRQRAAIARALAARPRALLLDEPFGALDAITRSDLQTVFGALRRRLAVTTVLVTHDLHEAIMLADRIAVLRSGRIEQVAVPDALIASPETGYVRELLLRARIVT